MERKEKSEKLVSSNGRLGSGGVGAAHALLTDESLPLCLCLFLLYADSKRTKIE